MIRVYIDDSDLFGPVVTRVKGLRAGVETLTRKIENALCYTPDGRLSVQWAMVPIEPSLKRRVVVISEG